MKYHLKCLNTLRKSRQKAESGRRKDKQRMSESRVFVELAIYIEKAVDSGTLLFKLSDLHSLYVTRLKDLGIVKTVNKTRLKDFILNYFQGAQEQYDGRNTILIFNSNVKYAERSFKKKRLFRGCHHSSKSCNNYLT